MKKKTVLISILLAGSVVLTVFGCSQKKPHGFEDRLGGMIDKISSSLNLTEEQKKKAVEIKEEILNKNKELRKSESKKDREIEEAFSKQIKNDKFDEKAVNKLLDAKIEGMEEMRRFMIMELKKFHAVLTPEQRIKLSDILKEIGARRGPKMKKETGR